MLSFFKQATTSHQDPAKDARQNILNLVRHAISGATAKIDPPLIPQILQYCDTVENSAEVLFAINEQMDHFCDMPLPVLKALKLILICLHKHYDSFFPAAQAFAPELETVLLLSFNKPSATNIKLIHQLAFQLYAHMVLNGKLPTLEFAGIEQEDINAPMPPPQPQEQPVQRKVLRGRGGKPAQRGGKRPAGQQQRPAGQQQRPGQQRPQGQQPPKPQAQSIGQQEDPGSLIMWEDDEPSTPQQAQQHDDFSTDLLSLDEEPAAPSPQQNEKSSVDNLPDDQKPRMPAVFAGVKAAPQREEESLLSFGDDFGGFKDVPAGSGESESLLFGDFSDPISDTPHKSNDNTQLDDSGFVFSEATSTDAAPDFAEFQPNFDDPAPLQQKTKLPTSAPLFSKPKYKPKKKVPVANTVQQGDFDPFGTNNDSGDFNQQPQSGSGSGLFDMLSDNEVSTPVGSQDGSIKVSGSEDLFDMLDSNPADAPIASHGNSSAPADLFEPIPGGQSNESKTFDPFGSAPAQSKPVGSSGSASLFDMIDQAPSPKASAPASGSNVFDMLDDGPANSSPKASNDFDMFGGSSPSQKTSAPASGGNVFDMLGDSPAPTKPQIKQPETFDPFGKSAPAPAKPAANNAFDPFGGATSKPASNAFDMMAAPAPKPSPKGSNDFFGAPKPAKQGSHDLFDMLGDSPAPTPAKPSPPAAQNSGGGDLFSILDGQASPQPAAQPQGNSFGFDNLSKPPQQSSGVFDPFGGSAKPAVQASASSGGLFDPFDSFSSGGSKPAAQPQQPPQQPKQSNNDIFDLF